AILGISTRQIWTLRATGALPAIRIGRSTRFRMSDLQRLVKEGVK
ncbi:MAG: helix-turn-helix domain-containing protein, partial [Phycisphaerales bacterium]|nr:helix-turn-helix domain-containing protein [Phycisphaerales bacterium]